MGEPAGKDYIQYHKAKRALQRGNDEADAPFQREENPRSDRKASVNDEPADRKPSPGRKRTRQDHTAAESSKNEVVNDLSPYLEVHKNGKVVKLGGSAFAPPSERDPTTGVSSKTVEISANVSARVYLSARTPSSPPKKLPILVYYHGGGFCLESAFSTATHGYVNQLAAKANAVVISVEYRLAPDHPVLVAFGDSWEALQWVASHLSEQILTGSIEQGKAALKTTYRMLHRIAPSIIAGAAPAPAPEIDRANPVEPWLVSHGDFSRLFVGGDGAGGTIAHYVSLQAGKNTGKPEIPLPGGVKILGTILCFPYFVEKMTKKESIAYRLWMYVSPNGIDDTLINPFGTHFRPFQFQKMFVCYGEKDALRIVDEKFVKAMKCVNGWEDRVQYKEVKGEDHCFQIRDPTTPQAQKLIKEIASFLKG